MDLREIPLTTDNFPADAYVVKPLKNSVYAIPEWILPTPKLHEIEVR